MGDLHGNYNDLVMFKDRFWSMGIDMTPARLLFLGDYVDRGPHSVELSSLFLLFFSIFIEILSTFKLQSPIKCSI